MRTARIGVPSARLATATAILSLFVIALELGSFVPTVASPTAFPPTYDRGTPLGTRVEGSSVAGPQLSAAERSLASGAGPAGGAALSCSGSLADADAVSCGAMTSAVSAQTSTNWSEVTHPSPAARTHASMVYDGHDGYVLLFGGAGPGVSAPTLLGDTWKFSAGIWTELHPKKAPSPREGASMTYDAADGYVVLYGGHNGSGVLGDTWKFVGGTWTQLDPSSSPPALAFASIAYDAKDGYVVLFGGLNGSLAAQATTWKFVAGNWTKVATPAPNPTSSYDSGMGFDATDGYVVLFGGYNASGALLANTWTFVGGAWTKLSPTSHPSARAGSAIALSVKDGVLVLFGGSNGTAEFSDTWTFAAGQWTKISSAFTPSKRAFYAMASGTATSNVILFGGQSASGSLLNDTWTFHGLVWAISTPRTPAARQWMAMTYDEGDGYVLLFGGRTSTASGVADTWKFQNGVWTPLHPAVSPPPRYLAGMVYDQADGYVLLYGGGGVSGVGLSDTWSFHAGNWTEISSLGPPARLEFSMTYDEADGYVLLFGGQNETTLHIYDDTWTYSAGVWSELFPSSSPSGRFGAQMVYDSEDGYVLFFSGANESGSSKFVITPPDTWTFLAGQWTNVTSLLSGSAPPGVFLGGLIDDTYAGYPILYGGESYPSITLSDATYAFTGSGWSRVSISASPGPLDGFGIAFAPPSNEIVVFGGAVTSGAQLTDGTWTYV